MIQLNPLNLGLSTVLKAICSEEVHNYVSPSMFFSWKPSWKIIQIGSSSCNGKLFFKKSIWTGSQCRGIARLENCKYWYCKFINAINSDLDVSWDIRCNLGFDQYEEIRGKNPCCKLESDIWHDRSLTSVQGSAMLVDHCVLLEYWLHAQMHPLCLITPTLRISMNTY